MNTLHIEITVNDISAFKASFAEHAEVRHQKGVRAERVRRHPDSEGQLVIDLDFDSRVDAEAFLAFLRKEIWAGSPVVVGTPSASILEAVEV